MPFVKGAEQGYVRVRNPLAENEAYLRTDPAYDGRVTVPALIDVESGLVVTNDYPQITLDLDLLLVEHLGDPQQRVALDALGGADQRRVPVQQGRRRALPSSGHSPRPGPADRRILVPKRNRDHGPRQRRTRVGVADLSGVWELVFKLKLDNGGHEILGIVSGKMRKHFIRILPGDRVKVQLSPYDLTKGRIVFRQK